MCQAGQPDSSMNRFRVEGLGLGFRVQSRTFSGG